MIVCADVSGHENWLSIIAARQPLLIVASALVDPSSSRWALWLDALRSIGDTHDRPRHREKLTAAILDAPWAVACVMILDRSGFPLPPFAERTSASAAAVCGAMSLPIEVGRTRYQKRPLRAIVNNLGGGEQAERCLIEAHAALVGSGVPLSFADGHDPFVSLCDALAWATHQIILGRLDPAPWVPKAPAILFGRWFTGGRTEEVPVQALCDLRQWDQERN